MNKTAKAYIFIGGMVHGAMVCEFLPDLLIRCEFVGHQVGLAADSFHNGFAEGLGFHVCDME